MLSIESLQQLRSLTVQIDHESNPTKENLRAMSNFGKTLAELAQLRELEVHIESDSERDYDSDDDESDQKPIRWPLPGVTSVSLRYKNKKMAPIVNAPCAESVSVPALDKRTTALMQSAPSLTTLKIVEVSAYYSEFDEDDEAKRRPPDDLYDALQAGRWPNLQELIIKQNQIRHKVFDFVAALISSTPRGLLVLRMQLQLPPSTATLVQLLTQAPVTAAGTIDFAVHVRKQGSRRHAAQSKAEGFPQAQPEVAVSHHRQRQSVSLLLLSKADFCLTSHKL